MIMLIVIPLIISVVLMMQGFISEYDRERLAAPVKKTEPAYGPSKWEMTVELWKMENWRKHHKPQRRY